MKTHIALNDAVLLPKDESLKLTDYVLQIDWEKNFPYIFKKAEDEWEFVMDRCSTAEVDEFLNKNINSIFTEKQRQSSFLAFEKSHSKSKYYEMIVDHFSIKTDGRMIGYFSGNLEEHDTYYLRYVNILKEYRGSGISIDATKYFLDFILSQTGIRNVRVHTVPSNLVQLKKILSYDFSITGQYLSDRWGTLIEFTKTVDNH
ncbi:MAG: GNAT family N-acetyltransferase [Bacteriovoracaceae bacterium]|nr:GNAT family N-acetyltransferase [Bacteriovoracaceae bacterium]